MMTKIGKINEKGAKRNLASTAVPVRPGGCVREPAREGKGRPGHTGPPPPHRTVGDPCMPAAVPCRAAVHGLMPSAAAGKVYLQSE